MTRKFYISLLVLSIFMGFQAKSQNNETQTNGIHVLDGVSYDSIHSSNIGQETEATGLNSFAGGYQSLAQGSCSFAFGNMAHATQPGSYALGSAAHATASTSLSIGFNVTASQNSSIIIGSGPNSTNHLTATVAGITMGMGSTHPTFFVSKASVSSKTGKVAIGDVTPQAKLHIRSDVDEDASIILAPAEPTENNTYIRLRDQEHLITVNSDGDMEISAGSTNLLGVNALNFNVDAYLMKMGSSGSTSFTICTNGTPSIGLNARQSNGQYIRDDMASSYAVEFGDVAFKLRTAGYTHPRSDVINNWIDAVTVKVGGGITFNGKVGINTENQLPNYALAVDGGVITTKVYIQDVENWSDYVFAKDYCLMPLGKLKTFINEHHHLPGVPSENEVRKLGFDIAAMQAVLLEKVEELTLYIVRQQEEIDSLRQMVTVHFGYDACGNRVSRTLEFTRMEEGANQDGDTNDAAERWQASLLDTFVGNDAMLFPNPTESGFFLSLTGEEMPQNVTAILYTADGKIIEQRTLTGFTEEFDLDGKPNGLYLLQLSSKQETRTWKIIKRK